MSRSCLEEFIHDVIQENLAPLPSRWYHGSQFSGMKSIQDYSGRLMFLTDSLVVAKDYTRQQPGLQAGRRPKGIELIEKPTVYELMLDFSEDLIFDFRKPEHADLFRQLSKESLQNDPEGGFRKNDVAAVHAAPGSSIRGVFPSWGIVQDLMQLLSQYGFIASIFAEGSQGASLCVRAPQHNLTLVREIEL